MADFTPKKVSGEASKAKGSLAHDEAEHMSPPTIYLQHHHLAKLGLHDMPKVGSKLKISGLAHVGSTSESSEHAPSGGKAKGGEGNTHRTMTLHLHKMDIGKEGISETEQEETHKAGAKAAMDAALTKGEGSESARPKGAGGKEGHKDG